MDQLCISWFRKYFCYTDASWDIRYVGYWTSLHFFSTIEMSRTLPEISALRGILFLSVALCTIERQCARVAAFLHAYEGPMFSGLRSGSMVLSHVWLGLPGGRFQSDGGLRIAAVTAW